MRTDVPVIHFAGVEGTSTGSSCSDAIIVFGCAWKGQPRGVWAVRRHKFPRCDPARMIEMLVERWKKMRAGLFSRGSVSTMHAHPGFDERANQPRPNRTLMINGVPRTGIALIVWRVAGFGWRSERRPSGEQSISRITRDASEECGFPTPFRSRIRQGRPPRAIGR